MFPPREIERLRLLTILHAGRLIGRNFLPRFDEALTGGYKVWDPAADNGRRARRVAAGLCGSCGGPCPEGRHTCLLCGNRDVRRNAGLRQRRLEIGLCGRCGKVPPAAGRKACQRCIDVESERAMRRYRERKGAASASA